MKKIGWALVLAVCLLCACAGMAAEREADFAIRFDSADDVSCFVNSGTCALSLSDACSYSGGSSLRVSSRSSNTWDAADLKVGQTPIEAQTPFKISCMVYTLTDKEGEFSIGLAGGDYSYFNTVTVPGRTWTKVSAEITLDELRNLRFLCSSDNLIGVEYYIDDVEIILNPEDDDMFADYSVNFADSAEGWYARSEGSATLSRTEDGLYISGRTASWNSPGRDFAITPGKNYVISATVRQDEKASANFILSVAHTKDGKESYENLAKGEAKQGEWVTLSAVYTPGQYDSFVLYVETSGDDTLSFTLKDFSVKKKVVTFGAEGIPSLKETYADCFDFGCAVTQSEAINAARMRFYASQFSIMTPGNELKPDSVLDLEGSRALAAQSDTAVAVHFDKAKALLDFAWENNIKIHGHVLVWYQQTPDAFFHEGYDEAKPLVSRDVMLERLDNYIRLVMQYMQENYPGLIVSWDVVNEAVDDSTGLLRDCLWLQVVGQDYVERAFEIARKYAPQGTLLFYNDYNTPYQTKLEGICTLLDSLIAQGNIDGYGFQGHYSVSTPTMGQVRAAFSKIAEKGLWLRVSELDVEITSLTDENLRLQADCYASLMEIFTEYKDQLIAVQTWGVVDDLSWKSEKNPLLFDGKAQPKYAFWALTDPSQIPIKSETCIAYGPTDESGFATATEYICENFSFKVVFTQDSRLLVRVYVQDDTVDKKDSVQIYMDGLGMNFRRSAKQATETEGGYTVDFTMPLYSAWIGDSVPFDIKVTDESKGFFCWNDKESDTKERVMGNVSLKKLLPKGAAAYGKGNWNDAYKMSCTAFKTADADENGEVSVNAWACWDEDALYVKVSVQDHFLDASAANSYEQDSVEIFLDEQNDKSAVYGKDDHHYRVNFEGVLTIDAGYDTVSCEVLRQENGFDAYFTIPFTGQMNHGQIVGFDVRYNNIAPNGDRLLINFCDATDTGWSDPSVFGLLELE